MVPLRDYRRCGVDHVEQGDCTFAVLDEGELIALAQEAAPDGRSKAFNDFSKHESVYPPWLCLPVVTFDTDLFHNGRENGYQLLPVGIVARTHCRMPAPKSPYNQRSLSDRSQSTDSPNLTYHFQGLVLICRVQVIWPQRARSVLLPEIFLHNRRAPRAGGRPSSPRSRVQQVQRTAILLRARPPELPAVPGTEQHLSR